MASIYIISTQSKAKRDRYKVGIHTGTIERLLSRYRTYLLNPILYHYIELDESLAVESSLKNSLLKFRLFNNNDNLSEWYNMELNNLIWFINDEIEKVKIHMASAGIDNKVVNKVNKKKNTLPYPSECQRQKRRILKHAVPIDEESDDEESDDRETDDEELIIVKRKNTLPNNPAKKNAITCNITKDEQKIICEHCKEPFARIDNLEKHLFENRCVVMRQNNIQITKPRIVPFAEDGISNLTQTDIDKLFSTNVNHIKVLIGLVNLSPNKPMHHNIYIARNKDATCYICDGKAWKGSSLDKQIEKLIEAKKKDLSLILATYNNLDKQIKKRIEKSINDMTASNYKISKWKTILMDIRYDIESLKENIYATKKQHEKLSKIDISEVTVENTKPVNVLDPQIDNYIKSKYTVTNKPTKTTKTVKKIKTTKIIKTTKLIKITYDESEESDDLTTAYDSEAYDSE